MASSEGAVPSVLRGLENSIFKHSGNEPSLKPLMGMDASVSFLASA